MNRFIALAIRNCRTITAPRSIISRACNSESENVSAFSSSASVPADNPKVASLLKLGRLNHVAIATPDLKKATAMYRYARIRHERR